MEISKFEFLELLYYAQLYFHKTISHFETVSYVEN